jgi:hypothetical protein
MEVVAAGSRSAGAPQDTGVILPRRGPASDSGSGSGTRRVKKKSAKNGRQQHYDPSEKPFEYTRWVIGFFCTVAGGFLISSFMGWYAKEAELLDNTNKNRDKAQFVKKKAPVENFPPLKADRDRVNAPATMKRGNLVVGVFEAKVGPITLHGRETSKDFLRLTLRITNVGKIPLKYEGWPHPAKSADLRAVFRDVNKNYYNRADFGKSGPPDGTAGEVSIEPGVTITDVLVFEKPPDFVNEFELDLPTFRPTEGYYFRLPSMFVQKRNPFGISNGGMGLGMNTQAPALRNPAPPPAPTPAAPPDPVPPEEDPAVRAVVIREYKAGSREIEEKINGMGYDNGRAYRKKAYPELKKKIAEKHNLTVDQVTAIVGR